VLTVSLGSKISFSRNLWLPYKLKFNFIPKLTIHIFQTALHQLLLQQQWFDRSGLHAALRKNLQSRIVVGASPKAMDLNELDSLYANLNLDRRDSLYEMRRKLKLINLGNSEDGVNGVRATILNAYNFLDENTVCEFFGGGFLSA
jgi:hypothetical protein